MAAVSRSMESLFVGSDLEIRVCKKMVLVRALFSQTSTGPGLFLGSERVLSSGATPDPFQQLNKCKAQWGGSNFAQGELISI